MKARKTDLVALGFLFAAVVIFVMFQVFPYCYVLGGKEWEGIRGFRLWNEILDTLVSPDEMVGVDGVISVGVILGTLLVFTTPFLIGILARSRPLWWMVTLASGLVTIAISGYISREFFTNYSPTESHRFGVGLLFLILFPVLEFIGLLCIRKRSSEDEVDGLVESA